MLKKSGWLIVCILGFISCDKATNETHNSLSLLRQKWDLVSKNGDSLRYVGKPGDYYIFESDNKLYEVYDGKTDTFFYSYDGLQTILLYQYINGLRSLAPVNFNIDVFTNNQLIMSAGLSPVGSLKDSLSR
jgi:hypothetical protein